MGTIKVKIEFTSLLKRFYPELESMELDVIDLPDMLSQLDEQHSGLRAYIVEDNGALRKHVNIFLNGEMIKDRKKLSDQLNNNDTIHIIQALSGG